MRGRFSSSRSLSLNGPSPSRARRFRFTHRSSVSSFRPNPRATCAIGLPVSRTIRTSPSLHSRWKCHRSHRQSLPQGRRRYGTRGSLPFMHERSDGAFPVLLGVARPTLVYLVPFDGRSVDQRLAEPKAVLLEELEPFGDLETIYVLEPVIEASSPLRV